MVTTSWFRWVLVALSAPAGSCRTKLMNTDLGAAVVSVAGGGGASADDDLLIMRRLFTRIAAASERTVLTALGYTWAAEPLQTVAPNSRHRCAPRCGPTRGQGRSRAVR